jgi:hypothetical protein
MTADRELLELAAKAIGAKPDGVAHDGTHWFGASKWNPLTDDGDALRLAVKLQFTIQQKQAYVISVGESHRPPRSVDFVSPESDLFAATRRAIVLAAAEIGRAMSS